MEKSESIKEIVLAITKVMAEVKGIEKSMNVGSGTMSYKGVPDQEVKKIVGEAMVKHGLSILPISVDAKTKIDRWEEMYNGVAKQKQSILTEVVTSYLLMHTSGEYVQISGYGHGVDSQDKGAGKATTYALKYALLYSFLIPTGKIDDSDKDHSDTMPVPSKKASPMPDNSETVKALQKEYSELINKHDHVFNKEEVEKYLKGHTGWTESSLMVAIKKINAIIQEREEMMLNLQNK